MLCYVTLRYVTLPYLTLPYVTISYVALCYDIKKLGFFNFAGVPVVRVDGLLLFEAALIMSCYLGVGRSRSVR